MSQYGGGTQINLPTLTKINKIIIIICGVFFITNTLLSKFIGFNISIFFGLSGVMFLKGFLYQIITYPILCQGLMEILFSSLIIWFIGSELESSWGQKKYLGFLAVSVLGAGITYLLISIIFFSNSPVFNYPLNGLAGVTNALCLAYGIIYPNRVFLFMLLFPVKTKYFCMLLVGIQLYIGVASSHNVAGVQAWGHLVAMGFAYIYMLFISSNWYKEIASRRKMKKRPSHLTIVGKDDDKKSPKYWQ